MSSLLWLADVLAVLMLAVALFSAGRLVSGITGHRSGGRDAEIAHMAMGLAMAGMLAGSFAALPDRVWVPVFAGATLWFGGRLAIGMARAAVDGHHLADMLASGSMLYMLLAQPTWMGMMDQLCGARMVGMTMSGMSQTKLPLLGVALAAALVVQALALAHRSWRRRRDMPLVASSGWPDSLMATPSGMLSVVQVLERPAVAASLSVPAPRLCVACRIVMALTMAAMLVAMA